MSFILTPFPWRILCLFFFFFFCTRCHPLKCSQGCSQPVSPCCEMFVALRDSCLWLNPFAWMTLRNAVKCQQERILLSLGDDKREGSGCLWSILCWVGSEGKRELAAQRGFSCSRRGSQRALHRWAEVCREIRSTAVMFFQVKAAKSSLLRRTVRQNPPRNDPRSISFSHLQSFENCSALRVSVWPPGLELVVCFVPFLAQFSTLKKHGSVAGDLCFPASRYFLTGLTFEVTNRISIID